MNPTATQSNQYPLYKCHKEVSAAKIQSVERGGDGSLTLHLYDGFDNVVIPHEEMQRKPRPETGWYLVLYGDGYRTFSPAKAFEEGYTPVSEMADESDNVIAFDSAMLWREYAAALERKLNTDTASIAGNERRTEPPSTQEIREISGLPATGAGSSEQRRRATDWPNPGDVNQGQQQEEGELDTVAANSTG
jgi:hypothetical protein